MEQDIEDEEWNEIKNGRLDFNNIDEIASFIDDEYLEEILKDYSN